jgi:hypothetical protein
VCGAATPLAEGGLSSGGQGVTGASSILCPGSAPSPWPETALPYRWSQHTRALVQIGAHAVSGFAYCVSARRLGAVSGWLRSFVGAPLREREPYATSRCVR